MCKYFVIEIGKLVCML